MTHDKPVPRAARSAHELLLERELRGLRSITIARLVMFVVWSPLALALGAETLDRAATLALLVLYPAVAAFAFRAIARRRHLTAVGVSGAGLDIVVIATLPYIWYSALGGAPLPVGLTLKSSVTVLALMLIAINALALRPLYPAIVTVGALLVHLVLLSLAVLDENTEFTGSYLTAYTDAPVSTGRALTSFVVLLLAGTFVTRVTHDARVLVREAARLENTNAQLGRYFSPNIVRRLTRSNAPLQLAAERRELSFVFTDLAGFTSLVERTDPAVLVPLLNEYLDGLVRIAFDHDGTIDKVVGDAVHVIFGAPERQPDHAARAVACALAIDRFAESIRARSMLGATRIGISTGTAMVGDFGGEALFDYTAHGDAVNLAARLEQANKALGTRICASSETADRIDRFHGRPAGALRLRGVSDAIEVFEPLQPDAVVAPDYVQAFNLMAHRDPGALHAFEAVVRDHPHDHLASFHLARLRRGELGVTVDLGA